MSGLGPVRPASPRSRAVIARHVVRRQLEVEQREVLAHPLRAGVDFGNTTLPRCTCQRRTTWEGVRPAAAAIVVTTGSPSTAPLAIGDHASVTIPCASPYAAHRVVEQVRVQLDLVDGGRHVGLGEHPLEVCDLEVRDADRARAPVAPGTPRAPPGGHVVAVVEGGQRPVDEEQVDVVGAQVGQRARRTRGGRRRAGAAVVELARDVDVGAVEPGRRGSPRRPPPRCRTSRRCRCGGSRPRARRHRRGGLGGIDLEHAEPELRDRVAVVELDRGDHHRHHMATPGTRTVSRGVAPVIGSGAAGRLRRCTPPSPTSSGTPRRPWNPRAIADRLQPLLAQDGWLAPEHQAPGADSYRQHLLHVSDCRGLSVVALVWKPGQGTPIHDHVSWCVVGVYKGLERETRYTLADGRLQPPRPSRRTPATSRRSSRPPRTSIASRPAATSSRSPSTSTAPTSSASARASTGASTTSRWQAERVSARYEDATRIRRLVRRAAATQARVVGVRSRRAPARPHRLPPHRRPLDRWPRGSRACRS